MKLYLYFVALASWLLVSPTVQAQDTAPVLSAYYALKDALVATNPGKAKTEAVGLVSAIRAIKVDKLSSTTRKALNSVSIQAIALSKTNNIEAQRQLFEPVSAAMITVAQATKTGKAYVQYCPMAFDGKGASWLSAQKEIRNPYFGSKMLHCGSVRQEI